MSFASRFAKLRRDLYHEEWWGMVFGRPVALLLLTLIGDVAFVTPNLLTTLSFLVKLGCAAAFAAGYGLVPALALQIGYALDCADGQLARYREKGSALGSLYDKVTDLIGLFALLLGVGFWATSVDPSGAPLLWVSVAFGGRVIAAYAYWALRDLQRNAGSCNEEVHGPLTFEQFLKAQMHILAFNEADLYFWLGLFALLRRPDILAPFLAVTYGVGGLARVLWRLRQAADLDERKAPGCQR